MKNDPREPVQLSYATASSRREGPFTLREWLPVMIAGAVILALIMPDLFCSRGAHKNAQRTACSARLRAIGQALGSYAKNQGTYPDKSVNLQKALVDFTEVDIQDLVCPCAAKGQTSYYYVPGHRAASDPNQVVVYEDPRNHGDEGGNVLFQDGHVKFIKGPRFQALINSLKLPDGRPWAPHLAGKK